MFIPRQVSFSLKQKIWKALQSSIESKKLTKRLAERINVDQNALPGLPQARQIVIWSFNKETEKGTVSPVFDLEGRYMIAVLKEIREKGTPTLEQLKRVY